MTRKIFKAQAAWVNGRELRTDVAVVVEGDTIADILPADRQESIGENAEVIDTALLLPGFINAHCHLEYTHMQGKLPRGAVPFGEWVAAIVAAKNDFGDYEGSSKDGVRQLIAGGTATVVETVSMGASPAVLSQSGLRHALMFECLGTNEDSAAKSLSLALARIDESKQLNHPMLAAVGISPHAPYSVGKKLRQMLRGTSAPELPFAWHLHESADEMELFKTGGGSIRDLLSKLKLPLPFEEVPGKTPLDFLADEQLEESIDVAYHLNFASDTEAARFAAPRAIVHCPGTHRYFEREPFPMWRYLNAGANVCLGTDSMASSDTLSMLENLRLAAAEFPVLTGCQLLDLVTRHPAKAKVFAGLAKPLGVIARGAFADFTALQMNGPLMRNMRDVLLDDSTRIGSVYAAGCRLNA